MTMTMMDPHASDLARYAAESDVLLILHDHGTRAWIGCNHLRTKDRECEDSVEMWMDRDFPRASDAYDAYEADVLDDKLLLRMSANVTTVLDEYDYLFEYFVKRCRWTPSSARGKEEEIRFPPPESIVLVVGLHSSPSLLVRPDGEDQTRYMPEIANKSLPPMVLDNLCLYSRNILWKKLVLCE